MKNVTITWHDLIDDPNDVPKLGQQAIVTVEDLDHMFCTFNARYMGKNIWASIHDGENLSRIGYTIIAWTELLKPYIRCRE